MRVRIKLVATREGLRRQKIDDGPEQIVNLRLDAMAGTSYWAGTHRYKIIATYPNEDELQMLKRQKRKEILELLVSIVVSVITTVLYHRYLG